MLYTCIGLIFALLLLVNVHTRYLPLLCAMLVTAFCHLCYEHNYFVNTVTTQSAPVEESSDGRADLMAAIRNAGGKEKAKLKDAKQRKEERKKEKEKSSAAASGGDLMSDLFSKLTMRRKGISGSKQEQPSGSSSDVSAMDRISAMIPPPKARADTTDSADWD